ncbi:IclR family transcriptional regulator [Paenibacillus sp. 32352]|uniref:IclR family transcriptional regulator n=1 Tax=Paenibacillus sp. 32352 TaxID=1969111 RepID=UPI0009AD89FE|nr:IclR family transcriptional regulator [Paenibacillus sp. 32352]
MLKTLDNSLKLLSYFTRETPQWGVRELAKEMNMSHSIAHRILSTFEEHGYLIQNQETKKYTLGIKWMELGAVVKDNFSISDFMLPVMRRLAAETGESTYLIWRDGDEGICVEIVESSQTIRYGVTVGSRSPLCVGASNKVIMAYLRKDVQMAIMDKGLRRYTDRTIVSKEELSRDLDEIRKAGWAYSMGEYTEEVFAIAVPIFNARHEIMASLAIGGPDFRMPADKIEPALEHLKAAKSEIQRLLAQNPEAYRMLP